MKSLYIDAVKKYWFYRYEASTAGGAIEDGRLALRFVCANPDVTVVIPGMYDVSEIEKIWKPLKQQDR